MDPVQENIDEEQGETSFRQDDEHNIEQTDFSNSTNQNNQGPLSSFTNMLFRRSTSNSDNAAPPRPGISLSSWKQVGSRRIRFASERSDVNNDDIRGIVATPMDSGQAQPMAPGLRFFKNIQHEAEEVATAPAQLFRQETSNLDGDEYGDHESNENQMYRLQATRGARDVGCCRRTLRFLNSLLNCGALTESSTEQNLYLGFGNPNRWLIDLFFWLFRKGWITVIVFSLIWYYVLVLIFSLFIVWGSDMDSYCVRVGGARMGELDNRSLFMDAFSLSWNTFSTVGYGSTYPALSTESDQNKGRGDGNCAFISFITSIEALVGCLYAGFTGAIIFAKVTRITQRAYIRFSDPLTVRFGTGVDDTMVDDDEDKPQNEAETKKVERSATEKIQDMAKKVAKPSPFPVITFRVANELHNTLGGEIINANVKAVVLIESTKSEDQVSEDLEKKIKMERKKRKSEKATAAKLRKTGSKRLSEANSDRPSVGLSERSDDSSIMSEDEPSSSESSRKKTESAMTYLQSLNALAYKAKTPLGGKKMKIDEEEVCGTKIVPRMVFTKLELETSEHPLFKRIWRFKHIINQNSPLLTCEAQKAIMENNGNWPWQWNNHEDIRKAIRFNQMIVSFTGISNISGASVYKQKIYDYVDTVVGYKFVNTLYRGGDGVLQVDLNLISDVKEQTGGGGEPLSVTGGIPHRVSSHAYQS